MSALTAIRVIELADSVAGEYCGKLLADFGAEVIKVEPPERGSATRAMAPVLAGGCEGSVLFAYLNTNKQSVVLDLASASGTARLHQLIETADAVIGPPATDWAARHPSVVFCTITPHGQGAPPEFDNARSITVFHASGWGDHTPSHADPAKPPLQGPGRFLADYEAGLEAALCVASSLFGRLHTGTGECIDISAHAVLVSRADCILGRFITGEAPADGTRDDYDQSGPAAFFACADGYVYLYMTSRAHWHGMKTLMGQPKWLDEFDDDWLEFSVTADKVATFRRGFAAWVAGLPREEVSERAQRLGVPLVPVNGAADLHRSPQYRHRGFFQRVRHPVLGEAAYPTVPYLFSASPARISTAAPSLGQHTRPVLDGIATGGGPAGGQGGAAQNAQGSARRTAGRGARRRTHQGVGWPVRGEAAGDAGRRSHQDRNRRQPRGNARLRRHRHQPCALLFEHQSRDPQRRPRHQIDRRHGPAA